MHYSNLSKTGRCSSSCISNNENRYSCVTTFSREGVEKRGRKKKKSRGLELNRFASNYYYYYYYSRKLLSHLLIQLPSRILSSYRDQSRIVNEERVTLKVKWIDENKRANGVEHRKWREATVFVHGYCPRPSSSIPTRKKKEIPFYSRENLYLEPSRWPPSN